MENIVDSEQMALSEASWFWSTLFKKGYIWQDKGLYELQSLYVIQCQKVTWTSSGMTKMLLCFNSPETVIKIDLHKIPNISAVIWIT